MSELILFEELSLFNPWYGLTCEGFHPVVNCLGREIVFIEDYRWQEEKPNPAGIYLVKVNNRNTRTWCEICSKLTMKIPERRQWRCSGIFIVNFEYISHIVLVLLLLTLSR